VDSGVVLAYYLDEQVGEIAREEILESTSRTVYRSREKARDFLTGKVSETRSCGSIGLGRGNFKAAKKTCTQPRSSKLNASGDAYGNRTIVVQTRTLNTP
jgi:hypothetical protein